MAYYLKKRALKSLKSADADRAVKATVEGISTTSASAVRLRYAIYRPDSIGGRRKPSGCRRLRSMT